MPVDSTRAKEIFFAAVQISNPAERAAYLDRECDDELRKWVDALLWAHDRPSRPPADAAPPTAEFPSPHDISATGVYDPNATGALESAQSATDLPPEAAAPAGSSSAITATFHPSAPGAATESYGASAHEAADKGDGPQVSSLPGGSPESRLIGGRYQIVELIGEGGMGSVYLARQSEPVKRDVALKLIKRGADSRTVVARFEAERQALALMDHPNIARVYDGGTTPEGQPYFVMELVRGVPITKFCDDSRLPPKNRLELFVEVCRAVQHAHQKGIIHRDLKPANILVTEVDGRPTPKVIDFGVAKAVDQRLTDESIGDEGIVGTPVYMSPEQTDPTVADIDTRTDVYAMGVILYELLTGSPPITPKSFRRGAILEMMRMVREVEPEHLSTKASSADALPNIAASRGLETAQLLSFLRGDVDWIVLKALEKDRERRYESANGMATDILRYLANEPVVARPPSRGYRLKKFVRRNRSAVAASALIALALAIGVVGVFWQWREAVSERNQKELARAEAVSERDQKELARAEAVNNARVALEQRRVALDTVGQMVTTVRAELLTRPDLQRALTEVIRIARGSLDSIIRNPNVDISLNDTTRAVIHDLKARTLRDQGDTPGALAEFNRAAEIFQAILDKAAEGPDKDVVRKNLVIVLISVGQTSLRTGSQADARGYYERAAQILGSIGDKSAADYRRLLIRLYLSMGAVTIDLKPREARENYRGALRVAEDMSKQESADMGGPSEETRFTLMQLHSALGQAENRVRDSGASERAYTRARTIAEERVTAQPDDPGRKKELAHITERIGDVFLRTNRPDEAARQFAAAAAIFRPIADADRKSVDAQADLARVLYSQGLVAARAGNKGAAAKFFQESLDIRKNRPNLNTETVAQRDLMMSLAQVGLHTEATKMAEAVRAKLPKDPGALLDVANCYAVCSVVPPAAGTEKVPPEQYAAKALAALKQAIDAGYGDKVNLETEPDLGGIRSRAEFKELVNRVPEP